VAQNTAQSELAQWAEARPARQHSIFAVPVSLFNAGGSQTGTEWETEQAAAIQEIAWGSWFGKGEQRVNLVEAGLWEADATWFPATSAWAWLVRDEASFAATADAVQKEREQAAHLETMTKQARVALGRWLTQINERRLAAAERQYLNNFGDERLWANSRAKKAVVLLDRGEMESLVTVLGRVAAWHPEGLGFAVGLTIRELRAMLPETVEDNNTYGFYIGKRVPVFPASLLASEMSESVLVAEVGSRQ
jgi:hypothetical protein